MQAEDYRPIYDNTVEEFLSKDPQNRPPVHINKLYCLMMTSARLLAGLFDPIPTIFMAAPIKQAGGSPFEFNHLVPWFRFADGTERNAGVLAQYWGAGEGFGMPGVPFSRALACAYLDINTPVEGQ